MQSSEVLKAGDRVAVPWGVDTREGEVVAVYQTGAIERVVVRLMMPDGDDDESPTVVLPVDTVTPLSDNPDLPAPGSWLRGFRYEREVAAALARVLADWQPDVRLNAERAGREIDILLESEHGVIVGEVEAVDHLSEPLFDGALKQVRAAMATYPDAKGLLVTSSVLPLSVRKRVRTSGLISPDVGVVQWRNHEDDKRIRAVIHALLNDGSARPRAAEG